RPSHCLYHPTFSLPFQAHHQDLHSFPTRRSSDLRHEGSATIEPVRVSYRGRSYQTQPINVRVLGAAQAQRRRGATPPSEDAHVEDRKSTRLNSSHRTISYAVFCLKKKTDTSLLRT